MSFIPSDSHFMVLTFTESGWHNFSASELLSGQAHDLQLKWRFPPQKSGTDNSWQLHLNLLFTRHPPSWWLCWHLQPLRKKVPTQGGAGPPQETSHRLWARRAAGWACPLCPLCLSTPRACPLCPKSPVWTAVWPICIRAKKIDWVRNRAWVGSD